MKTLEKLLVIYILTTYMIMSIMILDAKLSNNTKTTNDGLLFIITAPRAFPMIWYKIRTDEG